ncbi:MAG: DMT family transporter [Candidatus Caldatribacteriaceae bacterium]
MRTLRHYFPMFGVLLFWGFSWPSAKMALRFMSPHILSLLRFSMGTLFLLLFAQRPIFTPRVVVGALLNGALFVTLVNKAVSMSTNPALASVLVYTQPLFVLLLLHCSREKLRGTQIFGVLLAFFGVVVSAGSVHFDRGALMAIFSGFVWAVGIVYYRKYLKNEDVFRFNTALNILSAIFVVPLALFVDVHFRFSFEAMGWGLLTAFVSQVAGFLLWFSSLKNLGVETASAISLLVPVWAYIFTYLFMAQIPKPAQIIGSLTTLLGVFLSQVETFAPQSSGQGPR